jgi:quinoprotein glucose dehydrogenase
LTNVFRGATSLFRIAIRLALAILIHASPSIAAETAPGSEWRYYGSDSGGSRYSLLDQINRQNVNQLKAAWILHTGDLPTGKMNATFECTPVVVDGVMYVVTSFSKVIALEAETGKILWTFDAKVNTSNHSYAFASRGVTFWRHAADRRIFLATVDGRLFALMA